MHYHVVFSTKHREPLIHAKWRSCLHEYLGGSLRGLEAFPQVCGGVADHVHLLFGMRSTEISDIVREVKKSATAWIRTELGERAFSWQEGYAALTVSPTSRKAVGRYIETQERHHRTKPFLDELKEMLEKAEIEYDPQYLD